MEDYIEGWTFEKERVVSVIWWTVFWIQPTRLFLGTAFVEYIVQALGESEVFTFGINTI